MSILVVADHDNAELKPAKRNAAAAAKRLTELLDDLGGDGLRRDDRSFLLVRRTGTGGSWLGPCDGDAHAHTTGRPVHLRAS